MSSISGTQVMWEPGGNVGVTTVVNGNVYTTDGIGRLKAVQWADVAALQALGYTSTSPEVTDNPVPTGQYGNG